MQKMSRGKTINENAVNKISISLNFQSEVYYFALHFSYLESKTILYIFGT